MKALTGIDTLHLMPTDYTLEPSFSSKVKLADVDSGTRKSTGNYPLYTVNGETFEGIKAYRNEEHFRLEMTPYTDQETGVCHISTKIMLTVPKVMGSDNYHPSDEAETRKALEVVSRELWDIGFHTNLDAALIRRLDAAKTVVVREPWLCYRHVFERFKPARMKGVGYETGIRFGNSQHQNCLYDKLEELAANTPRHEKPDFSRYPKNSIRAEKRWLTKEKFRAVTGMSTVRDALSDFGHIQQKYRDAMEKELFKSRIDGREALSVEATAGEMLAFIGAGERYWFEAWKDADWIANRVVDAHRLEVIKAAVRAVGEKAGLDSKSIRVKQNKLDLLYLQMAPSVSKSKRTVSQLYSEIREKVLA